jgi:DNA invertase Pin-like site-specific DNA recombinase
MTRAALYGRLSKDRSGLSPNCDIQLAEGREYAGEHGWTVVIELAENDTGASRYSTKPRPKYEQLLEMVKRGELDVIVATEGERLHRRPDEMSTLINLAEKHPLKIALTNDDGYDLTDSNGIYRARTGVALAERESRKTSERQKRRKAAQAREGRPGGGCRAYGYLTDNVTVSNPEAEVLRSMADKVIRGWGWNSVAEWANEQGHVTVTGRPFLGVTVRNMLSKVRYAGIREHLGTHYPAMWEPIFDPTTWERLQISIKLKSEKNVPKARRYLLTGLLFCGKCGGRMNGARKVDRPNDPPRRIYVCTECHKLRRGQPQLDWWIRELVLFRLDSPEMAALLKPGDDGELKALLEERGLRQAKLDSLVDDYASGLLSRTEFARAKGTAEALLAESVAQLDNLARAEVGHLGLIAGSTLRTAWNENPTDWRRNLIELLVKKIVIHPSQAKPLVNVDGVVCRFDASAVEVYWKV